MKKYEVRWAELQTFHTVVEAEGLRDAMHKVRNGDFEEAHDSGRAPDMEVYGAEEVEN